jgi:hypothetical protein
MFSTDAILSLLIQIPLVGIFVWFSLRLIKIFLDELQSRANRETDERSKRDQDWREFLREQSVTNSVITGRLAEEIKALAAQVAATNVLISQHDQAMRETAQRIERR